MRPSSGAIYRPIQSLVRGLSILQAINRAPDGWASIAELSKQTGLHRTTVRRMLETLQAEGYVRRRGRGKSRKLLAIVRYPCRFRDSCYRVKAR